jgi:hypothetical protein
VIKVAKPTDGSGPSIGRIFVSTRNLMKGSLMNSIIYIVGVIVIIAAILSLFGLR